MNTKPNDGGPAFPVVFDHGDCKSETAGMSLRDWFAGRVLSQVLADQETLMIVCKSLGCGSEEAAAHMAYELADAMLKAREQ